MDKKNTELQAGPGQEISTTHEDEVGLTVDVRKKTTKALLVWPELPKSHWSSHYSLPMANKRANMPPLGLITMAADLPKNWGLDLADLNIESLSDERMDKADIIFVSAMRSQRRSFHKILKRANDHKKTVVTGGPYVTTASEDELPQQDDIYIFKGEMEGRFLKFVQLFERGDAPRISDIETCNDKISHPDMTKSPVPRFDLLNVNDYYMLSTQFSRGCPHNCEFCDITKMLGRRPRTKMPQQILSELEAIYNTGFRGSVMMVDDNINGNPKKFKALLDELIPWQEEHGYPFGFVSQITISAARKKELLKKMHKAGFGGIFLGIETPSKKSLLSMNKSHNTHVDPLEGSEEFARHGIEVTAGLIVGADGDGPECFQEQLDFLQKSPISVAMICILLAMPNTDLWTRLMKEGRLYGDCEGDFSHFPNFKTKLPEREVVDGYKWLLTNAYKPRNYFDRALRAIELHTEAPPLHYKYPTGMALKALINSIWRQGIRSNYRLEYWRYLLKTLQISPKNFPKAMSYAIRAHHMIVHTQRDVLPRLSRPIPIREPIQPQKPNSPQSLTKKSDSDPIPSHTADTR